jgi:uncharacterized protein (TIGR03437 family)
MRQTCRHFRSLALCLLTGAIGCCWTDVPAAADVTGASTAPFYSAASIVNGASQVPGALAPNGIATIYGTNLSFTTRAVGTADLDGKNLPNSLEGVTVYVNGIASGLFYVSPGQINFLIPYVLADGIPASIYLVRQSLRGPIVSVTLSAGSPGVFQWDGNFAVAQHADGSLISPDSPAHPGDIVVLYAAGLGHTTPDIYPGSVASVALSISNPRQLKILLDGIPCDDSNIYYAGATPGYAGLYQINLRLPPAVGLNPKVQIVMGTQSSPATVQLFVD